MNEEKVYDRACEACLQNCFTVLSSAVAVGDEAGGQMRFRKCRQICLETLRLVETAIDRGATPGDNADVIQP